MRLRIIQTHIRLQALAVWRLHSYFQDIKNEGLETLCSVPALASGYSLENDYKSLKLISTFAITATGFPSL